MALCQFWIENPTTKSQVAYNSTNSGLSNAFKIQANTIITQVSRKGKDLTCW